jgi:glycosyltransferase involved in cell wall biosynthesis
MGYLQRSPTFSRDYPLPRPVSDSEVTVIVAAHNGERFLREALDSLFAQDFDAFEVVFVDDGSTDCTAEIARSFPVRYRYQENLGLASARNAGLAMARGELIAFLDDDDVLPPSKLDLQARYLREHPEIGCVLGRQEWIFEDGNEPAGLERDPFFGDLGGVPFGSAMIRRSALESVGGFDPTYAYAEDRDLFVRLREHGVEIVVLQDIVLYRRLHDSNMTLSAPVHHPLLRSLSDKIRREQGQRTDARDDQS